jgi:hypothetical protein
MRLTREKRDSQGRDESIRATTNEADQSQAALEEKQLKQSSTLLPLEGKEEERS